MSWLKLILLAPIVVALAASEASGSGSDRALLQLSVLGGYQSTTYSAYGGGGASEFSGLSYGGSILIGYQSEAYTFGVDIGVLQSSMSNSANTSTSSEELSQLSVSVMPRASVLGFWLAIGPIAGRADIDSRAGSVRSRTSFVAYGWGARLGKQFDLGSTFRFGVWGGYDAFNFSGISAVVRRRGETLSAGATLGVQF